MNELKTKPDQAPVNGAQPVGCSTGRTPPRSVRPALPLGVYLLAGDLVVAFCFAIWWEQWTWPLLVGWGLAVASHASAGLYRPRLHLALLDQLPQLISHFFIAMTSALTVPALLGVPLELRRHAAGAAIMIAGMLTIRGAVFAAVRIGRSAGAVRHPVLIIGSGARVQKVVGVLGRHASYGLRVCGYLADRPVDSEVAGPAWQHLGTLDDMARVVREHRVEILIVDESSSHRPGLLEGLRDRAGAPDAFMLPHSWEFGSTATTNDHIGGVPIVRVNRGWSLGQRAAKRLFDVVMAVLALVLLAPFMLLIAGLIMVEDGHGPLFRQVRVGRDGKLFTMYKFRSMRPAPVTSSDTAWSGEAAVRIGRIGRLIRATSIDELPQLFNILRGDMTFVGPRPERPHYVEQFSAMFPEYHARHRVTVGLTGLAQVSGLRGDTSIDDRVRHDNYYIDNWSLWFDVKVLVWTLGQAFGARGS